MNALPDLRFTMRPLGRLGFVIRIVVLLAAAYLVLRAILLISGGRMGILPNGWHFLDPLALIATNDSRLPLTILVHLCLTAGLAVLGIRRARDAGWSPLLGAALALPILRLFLFVALATAPGRHHTEVLDLPRGGRFARLIPRSRTGSAAAAIGISIALVVPLGVLNVQVLEDYGLALFIGLPFLLGALSAYLHAYHTPRTLRQSVGVALITVSIALLLVFLLAMEGLVCLLMAAPIVYAIGVAGALVGHALGQRHTSSRPVIGMLLLLTPSLMAFEAAERQGPPLFAVTTVEHIQAPPERVWVKLVTFSHMQAPTELLFRAGISYPIEARITGTGVGACRYCQFNTGPFVEPITVWDAPHRLAFDVKDLPPPMTELSIYRNVNAPHVHGFFRSQRGQFQLTALPDGSTRLEGTTWYTHDIWPTWYWRLWSDHILHRIHQRVLRHIKVESERPASS